jgi:hypothetical protein
LGDLTDQRIRRARHGATHDGHRPLRLWIIDPVVQAAAAQCVVQIATAVRGEHGDGRTGRDERTQLGNGDSSLAEKLEQQRLEFVVRAVDLVDQQHGRSRPAVAHTLKDRPVHQIGLGVEVGLGDGFAARLGQPDAQQLALVIPVVQRLGSGQPLIALQSKQRRIQHGGKRFRRSRLADTRFTLEEQRAAERDGQVDRRGGADVEQIVVGVETPDHVVNIVEQCIQRPCHRDTDASSLR